MLAGCGGGGGGGSEGVSSQVVSGVAAVGAPLAGEAKIKDSSNREKTTVIGSDGSFAFDVTDMEGPFILQATGSANGETHTLQSFADDTGTANINPFANAIVANAAEVDDPAAVFQSPDRDRLDKIKSDLSTAIGELLTKLRPLLQRFSAADDDPVRGHYRADHTGLDALFDKVKITLVDGILTIINKQTGAVIFTGRISDIKNGHFTDDDDNLPNPGTVPNPPTGITAAGGNSRVTVSWTAVGNATSYNIYWSTASGVTASGGIKIARATSPYIHTGLGSGTTYHYIVTAVTTAGESLASAEVSATTAAPIPVINGAALYTQYCATCHGALGASDYQGATAAQIISGIANFSAMRTRFNAATGTQIKLTPEQIDAIAAALL